MNYCCSFWAPVYRSGSTFDGVRRRRKKLFDLAGQGVELFEYGCMEQAVHWCDALAAALAAADVRSDDPRDSVVPPDG